MGWRGARRGRVQAAIAASALALLLAAPPIAQAGTPEEDLDVTIRRTAHGIPHIIARDYESMGYGYGYAFAQDNICVIADSYVTANAQRSRYFGPDAGYTTRGNGASQNNLNSDFFFQRIIDEGIVEELLAKPVSEGGPKPEIRQGVAGYVKGYNRYLADTGVANIPDPACRGADWVQPINEGTAFRRFYQLILLASQGVAIDGVGGAQPPTPPLPLAEGASQPRANADPGDRAADPGQPDPEHVAEKLQEAELPMGGIGSNAFGLGSEATANGSGMVLANPHFPWDGSERFYQAHLTIPGEANVTGAGLFGVPLVLIGHTDKMAWSHTVSTAYRFTPFEETLVPGSPTTYLQDGLPKQMEADEVTVQVDTGSGLEPRTRTLYSTDHGPVFNTLLGLPLFPWTPVKAFTMGDANATNFRAFNHFLETNQAQSVDELYEVLKRNQGIPWVNTIAADSEGKAFYADISVTPHVTDEKAQLCNTVLGTVTFQALRLPVLDGARSMCEWGSDPDAAEPGIFGPSNMPHLFRDDYVTNSNDSYWLSNPEEPLEGFDKIIGDERTARALRTRSGLVMVEERLAGTDGDPGNRYTLGLLQKAVFENRQHAAELFRDDLVNYCESTPTVLTQDGPVDISEACPVLEAWDLRDDLDSEGALLFRRFVARVLASQVPLVPPPAVFANGFDAEDPVHTPNGLQTVNPNVGNSLGLAVQELRDCEIPLDAGLRGYQYENRGDEQIPIHGGPGTLGVFSALNVSYSGDCRMYPNTPHGSSFVMATSFTPDDEDCPVDQRSILTYSLSTSPESPYFGDQTELFSEKQWVDLPYCEAEILADPELEVTELNGGYVTPLPEDCDVPAEVDPEDVILGSDGDDVLAGTSGDDVICAGDGDDEVRGLDGNDLILGNDGDDEIRGGNGNDVLLGAAGADLLFGNSGADILRGGPDPDRLHGGKGRDQLFGEGGRDELHGGRGHDTETQ